jgi:hypothetical protein
MTPTATSSLRRTNSRPGSSCASRPRKAAASNAAPGAASVRGSAPVWPRCRPRPAL